MEPTFHPESLIHLRKKRGWSQEELARRSGLATVTVVKLEQGKAADPHVSTLARVASATGCQIETFLLARVVSVAPTAVVESEARVPSAPGSSARRNRTCGRGRR